MEKTIARIADYILHVADAEQIILFGSQATGKQHALSDVDLLVICGNITGRNHIARQVRDFAGELSVKTDVIIKTKMEMEKALQQPGTFLYAAYKEGKIIFKKTV